MKKVFTILAVMSLAFYSHAQYYYLPYTLTDYGNPDGLNTEIDELLANAAVTGWTEIYGGTLGNQTATPTWSTQGTLPFAFNFNGNPVSTYYVSNTGVLTFAASAPANAPGANNTALPAVDIPDNSVACWGLLGNGGNDAIAYKTVGSAPNRQHWVQFNSFSDPSGTANCFTYWAIMMQEGTDRIFIVDRRLNACVIGLTLGVQIDQSTAVSVAASPNVNAMTGGSNDPGDNRYYEFIPGSTPTTDGHMVGMQLAPYLDNANAPFTFSGTLQNFGSDPINTFDLNYSVNGGTAVTESHTAPGTGFGSAHFWTLQTGWNPGADGDYTIEVWADNINGQNDVNPGNDEAEASTTVYSNATDRNPLHEQFTSSTCPPCQPANAYFDPFFQANDLVVVRYQVNWPGTGDPYYTAEVGNRNTYHGNTAAPGLYVDAAGYGVPQNYTATELANQEAVPAFMNLSAEHFVDPDNKSITVNVTIDPLNDYSGSNRVMISVMEEETFNNVKTNGETHFYNVHKKFLPDDNGTTIGALTAGNQVTVSETYHFQGDYILPPDAGSPVNHTIQHSVEEFDDLIVAVWAEDPSTGDVHQSVYSMGSIVSVEDVQQQSEFVGLYPNPANDLTALDYSLVDNQPVSIQVFNALGAQVYNEDMGDLSAGTYRHNLNVNEMNDGLYFVYLTIGAETHVKKMTVAK